MPGFITDIEVIRECRCFQIGEKYDIDPEITLLVGDQGSGKSTLLNGLMKQEDWLKIGLSNECMEKGVSTYFFDTEKMNPRITGSVEHESGDRAKNILLSHFSSHGEVMKNWILSPLKNSNEQAILFIDEPESGLSIRSQYALLKELLTQKKMKQIILSTHSIILMNEIGKVLSLEHKKWMKSEDFIETQKNSRDNLKEKVNSL